ncbi:uncharacterized protein LOC120588256 [Pteropus medius]|uniref:uncharacterized protein LOC120588256 n=1 Tax=Pteropus vampyrus TaxID=132908 RepID=UPI00196B5293|nr:uncharacterized protein LOC120588256 [Pteropus giganteus]
MDGIQFLTSCSQRHWSYILIMPFGHISRNGVLVALTGLKAAGISWKICIKTKLPSRSTSVATLSSAELLGAACNTALSTLQPKPQMTDGEDAYLKAPMSLCPGSLLGVFCYKSLSPLSHKLLKAVNFFK